MQGAPFSSREHQFMEVDLAATRVIFMLTLNDSFFTRRRARIRLAAHFAKVRHGTVRTKGSLSQRTAKLMVFKLVAASAKTWRRLKGENQLPKVVQGVKFQNGVEVIETPANHAA